MLAVVLSGVGSGADFYVAPDGRDDWSGRLAVPNATRTDGPLATPHGATRAVRRSRHSGSQARQPVTVQFRGGVYRLERVWRFSPADSGTRDAPIIYEAYPGETPVFSGGRQVKGWQRQGDGVWAADVASVLPPDGGEFHQLFVNGRRRPRARTPDVGSYFYSKRLLMDNSGKVCLGLTFAEGDVQRWPGVTEDARIVLFHNWVNSYNCVGEADWARRRLRFARRAGVFFLGPSVRYYVENVRAALDAPGEWFHDQTHQRLYYRPVPDEDPANADAVVPVLRQTLVHMQGEPRLGLYVEHIVLRGLTFRHTGADLSPNYPHSVQGAHYQRGAIFATGLRDAVVEDCEFSRLGEHALSLREACANVTVQRCHVFDVGGGGVYLSEEHPKRPDPALLTVHNTIENNLIHDGGHIFRAGCGVFLGGSASYNRVLHNEICDLSWMGVHLGWSWTGLRPAYTHHNEVAFNHIHHLGNGVLNDVGGIYTLGVSPGTVLHHNLIHDITRFERGTQGYGGWGIYLDAGSSEIRVEDNVVYDTRDGGLHLHNHGHPYGNLITNNIFAYSADGDLMRNADHEPDGNHVHLERNIVLSRNRLIFSGNNWRETSKFTSNRNCFWSEGGEPDFCGRTFTEWQAAGRDTESIVAAPGFVDAPGRDFHLRPGAAALGIGFQPIDLSEVGLKGAAAWVGLTDGMVHRTCEAALPPDDPLPFVEDAEEYDPGEEPTGATSPDGGTRVSVVSENPASGRQCLLFEDAADVTVWKPHWFVRFPRRDGRVTVQCRVRSDPERPAMFDVELRDWPKGEELRSGPQLRFRADGSVKARTAAGTWLTVGQATVGQWYGVRIGYVQGEGAPRFYDLELSDAAGRVLARKSLPFASDGFAHGDWFGFAGMDEKPAAFYVDDIRVSVDAK